ncbi:uncharacterized protein LOC131188413 [Ahaetulla prasina]|uniref:uncharacterized protein LOC131188413 n=1 Tax=Ahaetulla prasina TaxID=499056 RepID=UPI002647B593|nr:uncharacterized protein LOC131188413 [Ahaetulla prasina]
MASWPQGGRNLPAERGCCKRQSRLVFLGHDLSGSPVSVDVGLCRSLCGRGKSPPSGCPGLPRELSLLDFHQTLKERPPQWPARPRGDPHSEGCCPPGSRCEPSRLLVQDRWLWDGPRQVEVVDGCQCNASPAECLRLPTLKTFFPDSPLEQTLDERPPQWLARPRGDPHSEGCCPPGSRCEPSRLLVQDRWLWDGPRQVEVVDSCQCNASPAECLRLPTLKTFFPDSPLEQTLDVGRCAGPPPSQGGPFCVPTGFDSILLQGPNGKRLIRTLGGCQGQGASCYRVPHWEHYSEVVLNVEGRKREQRKEIDLGRCLGRCQQREPGGPRATASHCIPDGYETKTFQSRTGQLRTIFVIQTCKCGPKRLGAPMLPHLWSRKN